MTASSCLSHGEGPVIFISEQKQFASAEYLENGRNLTISNKSRHDILIIQVPFQVFKKITFCTKASNKTDCTVSGYHSRETFFQIPEYPGIHLEAPKGSETIIDISVEPALFPVSAEIMTPEIRSDLKGLRILAFGITEGVLITLLAVGSVYLFIQKKFSYFTYFLFILSAAVFGAVYEGYIYPGYFAVSVGLAHFFILLFAAALFRKESSQQELILLYILLFLTFCMLPFYLTNTEEAVLSSQIIYIIIYTVLVLISAQLFRRTRKQVFLIYLAGLTIQFLFSLAEMAAANTALPRFLIPWTIIGTVMESLFFGLALIADDRKEKEILFRHKKEAEEFRNQVAGDLHDLLGSDLVLLKSGLRKLINENYSHEAWHLIDLSQKMHEDLSAAVNIINEKENFELIREIENFTERISQIKKLSICFVHTEKTDEPPFLYRLQVFRILSGVISNILRHSTADEIRIIFRKSELHYTLAVTDNGIPFSWRGENSGRGLNFIRIRARSIHAAIRIINYKNINFFILRFKTS